MIEVEVFEPKKKPNLLTVIGANLKFWIWVAMHSSRFNDVYFGLNQSPIEFYYLGNHRFIKIEITLNKRLWFMYCVPFSIIDDYRKATKKDTSLIWK